MKIAVIGLLHHPIAEPFAGGMESHTWWMTKKLAEKGHDVTLFASGDSDPRLNLSPCIERAFATHPEAQTRKGRQMCNLRAYAQTLRHICEGAFDVIHNNALHPFILSSAADLPVPMLTILHTPIYRELAEAIRYASSRNRNGKLAAAAVSSSLAKEWKPLISAEVIYNGIDVTSWPVGQNKQTDLAFWYGRIVPEKAPHLAIQAAISAGYHIKIAGPIGDQAYFEEEVRPLLQPSQSLRPGLSGSTSAKAIYLGHLSHPKIKHTLSECSVFVNTPVWEEPYGFVYAEALASGTPVASFRSGAAAEILTERCGVLATEKTVPALAVAIRQAAKLPSRACRQRAESFCNIDSMIHGYEKLYRQLINRYRSSLSTAPLDIALPRDLVGLVAG